MSHRVYFVLGLFLLGCSWIARAGAPDPIKELNARPLQLPAREVPLVEILAHLEKQTGNAVNDVRSMRTNPFVALPRDVNTFWKALDAVGKKTGIGFSPYQPDGGVALVDRAYRELQTDISGPFRFAVKRRAVVRDDETQAHHCEVTLEMAWEPRIRPVRINLESGVVEFHKNREVVKHSLERQAARKVAGQCATDIELRMPAPERAQAKIDSLTGKIKVIGAPKMLDFKFANPATKPSSEQDGVKVRVVEVKQFPTRWEIDVEDAHPKGAILDGQSFEDSDWRWLTRVWLSWTDPETKKVVELVSRNDRYSTKSNGFVYRFEAQEKTPLPPTGAEVTLHYRVPARIVAFTVPFAFRDLPLP